MAFESPGFCYSEVAGEDLSSAQFKFVEYTSTGVIVLIDNIAQHHGILQNDPESGQMATVMTDGISKVVLGETVAKGDEVEIDTSGRAVVSAGVASVGKCFKGGAVNEIGSILLYPTPRDLVIA